MCYFSSHNHSQYSNIRLLDSINRPEDLIKYANDIGLKGICLSDHECLSGHVKFIKAYKEMKEKGHIKEDFRIAFGNEIYLVQEDSLDELKENYKSKNPDTKFYHFLLIAKNPTGYEQLKKLSSLAWENMFSTGFMERVPTFKKDFTAILKGGNVIGTSACLGGFIPQMILKWRNAEQQNNQSEVNKYKLMLHEFVTFCIDVLGKDNFFLEIQPSHQEEQNYVNRKLIDLSKVYGIGYIVATDGHYLKPSDRDAHRIYLQSQEGEREVDDFYQSAYVMSEEEAREGLSPYLSHEEIEIALKNTISIIENIEEFDLYHPTVIPTVKIEEFEVQHIFEPAYDKFEHIKNYAHSLFEIDRQLLFLIENGFNNKFRNKPLSREYFYTILERINTELGELWHISETLGDRLSSYYVLTKKVIDIIWNEGDSLVGVSRGSAAGYLINFLLDIIQVNPLDYNLPHFRHLTKERPELPDIDIDSQQNRRSQILEALKKYFGYNRVLNIATFGTEGSRSSLLSASRGLGIDIDEASFMTSLIPMERGQTWSLSDCYFGNKEKNRKPIKELVNAVEQFEGLKEISLKIEGLIKSRSIHASGVYIYNDDYTKFNAMMRASSGQPTTQFDMGDSDYMGNLKIDMLTIQSLDRIRVAMEMLIKDGYMEWQGDLRSTYNKYLHPNVLNYDNQDMWKKVADNAIPDLFQFDTAVGLQCAKKVEPKNVVELAVANSLMRLMPEGTEQPVDKYIRHKADPELWMQEMKDYGLDDSEIEVLKKHLTEVYGVTESQEGVMLLSMDSSISNFSIKAANKLRKGISKKKEEIIKETKHMFFSEGGKNGTRYELLEYVWNTQIAPQLGYSFSRLHSVGYSLIALQELNLAHFYPQLYWNVACLTVNAGADEDNEDNKGTNYGKVAAAIGNMKQRGIEVSLPDINRADFGFKADVENNQIIFGLKGINGINDDTVRLIIENRPYVSFNDFLDRMYNTSLIKKGQVIQLIKAGCFDTLGNRSQIMKQFIGLICEPKTKIGMQNFNMLIENDLVPEELSLHVRLYKFKNYISKKVFRIVDKPKDKLLLLDEYSTSFFNEHFSDASVEDFHNGNIIISEKKFKKEYDKYMDVVKQWISNPETLNNLNRKLFDNEWDKNANGSLSKWEMESVSFYNSNHELYHVNHEKYGIVNYFDMPEEPKVVNTYTHRGREINQYDVVRLVGTVLDRDKYKHTVTLLTPNGVVTLKFHSGQFSFYDRQISQQNSEGKKEVLEKSWFSRGTKILISGFRRENNFIPKVYKNSIYNHTVALIRDIDEMGNLYLTTERTHV